MIVEIEINIANDKGIPIQSFSKHFDSKFDSEEHKKTGKGSAREFGDFLAEYLSFSGRFVREKVLPISFYEFQKYTTQTVAGNKKILSNQDDEVEYSIKIGKDHTITGKMPLMRIAELQKAVLSTKEEGDVDKGSDLEVEKENSTRSNQLNMQNLQIKVDTRDQNSTNEKDTIEKLIQNAVQSAIKKYESNFFLEENLRYLKK